MKAFLCALASAVLTLTSAPAFAADVDLKVGDPAPKFEQKDENGKVWKSSDYIGKKIVVVYFYPADLTGGCTKQACGFRDDMKTLIDKDVVVVGVSGDSPENHQIFKKEHDLNFTLLSDEDGSVGKAFGVPVGPGGVAKVKAGGKDIELKRGVTEKRWTFVIDKGGKVAVKNTEVKAAEDSKAIIKAVEGLK